MRRTYVDGNGEKYDLDIVEIDLRKGSLGDLLASAINAEEDDKKIKKKSHEIENFIKTSGHLPTLERWFKLGKKLQFVDDLELRDEKSKKEAFQRLFKDFEVDPKRNPSIKTIARYPKYMYNLSKIPKDLVFCNGMTWKKWFDILEYKRVWKNDKVLKDFVLKNSKLNWNAQKLRIELQKLNKELKK